MLGGISSARSRSKPRAALARHRWTRWRRVAHSRKPSPSVSSLQSFRCVPNACRVYDAGSKHAAGCCACGLAGAPDVEVLARRQHRLFRPQRHARQLRLGVWLARSCFVRLHPSPYVPPRLSARHTCRTLRIHTKSPMGQPTASATGEPSARRRQDVNPARAARSRQPSTRHTRFRPGSTRTRREG